MKRTIQIVLLGFALLGLGVGLYVTSTRMAANVARKNDVAIFNGNESQREVVPVRPRQDWDSRELFSQPEAIKACEAISKRHDSELGELIAQGLDVNLSGEGGASLLHWAFICKNPAAFDLLLSAGADPDRKIYKSLDAPEKSVRIFQGDSVLFTILRASGRDRWQYFSSGLGYSKNVEQRDNDMATLLHVCMGPYIIHSITAERLDLLLAAGIDKNAQDDNGTTAAMLAVARERPDLALRMLEAGASPDVRDRKGRSLSDSLALSKKHAESLNNQALLVGIAELQAWLDSKE